MGLLPYRKRFLVVFVHVPIFYSILLSISSFLLSGHYYNSSVWLILGGVEAVPWTNDEIAANTTTTTSIVSTPTNESNSDTYSVLSPSSTKISSPYKTCYKNTKDLLYDQLMDLQRDNKEDYYPVIHYEICPGLDIKIGIPKSVEFGDGFINGQYPIILARPNSVISCQGCILRDGNVQLVAVPVLSGNIMKFMVDDKTTTFASTNVTLDNVTVRGITFTGQLDEFYGVSNGSVLLTAPGKNVTFENCSWFNLTNPAATTFKVGSSIFTSVIHTYFLDVTIHSSSFAWIVYEDYVIKNDDSSTVTVRSNFFKDILYVCVSGGCPIESHLFGCVRGGTCYFVDNCLAGEITYLTALLAEKFEDAKMVEDNNYYQPPHPLLGNTRTKQPYSETCTSSTSSTGINREPTTSDSTRQTNANTSKMDNTFYSACCPYPAVQLYTGFCQPAILANECSFDLQSYDNKVPDNYKWDHSASIKVYYFGATMMTKTITNIFAWVAVSLTMVLLFLT